MASIRSPGFRGIKLERCSRLCGFREKNMFKGFPIQVYVKLISLGAGPFLAQGSLFNKLGRGPLGEATYPI